MCFGCFIFLIMIVIDINSVSIIMGNIILLDKVVLILLGKKFKIIVLIGVIFFIYLLIGLKLLFNFGIYVNKNLIVVLIVVVISN